MFIAIANTVLGFVALLPTFYAVAAPVLLLAPLVGYGLLIGYWARAGDNTRPAPLLWAVTILYNLIGPVALWLLGLAAGMEPIIAFAITTWNVVMIIAATIALTIDWAEALDQRYERMNPLPE